MERATLENGPISVVRTARRTLRFEAATRTEVGLVREHNEDFVYCGTNLVAVADGVGGSVHGEVASALVIRAIGYLDDRIYLGEPDEELRVAERYVTERLADAVAETPSLLGMATTLTALRLDGDSVCVLHVGDSRAYRLRSNEWVQLTRDDSFVQDLVDCGAVSPAQALVHPARAVVSQALDGGPVRPHVAVLPAYAGDRYLVCSDGLSDYVAEAQIRRAVAADVSPEECCAELVDLALAAGAPDNVSCVVADLEPLD